MIWDELKEKAKELGCIIPNDYCIASNDSKVYNYTMLYYKDGVINTIHFGNICFVADHRNQEQMLMIMEVLK